MRVVLAAAIVIGGCHSHGGHEASHDETVNVVRARVTTRVRTERLETRLHEGRTACAAIAWEGGRPVCMRDHAEMVTVPLRADEAAYYCPADTLFWYCKSGTWLGPFESGLRPVGE